jgi:hypothetical protein
MLQDYPVRTYKATVITLPIKIDIVERVVIFKLSTTCLTIVKPFLGNYFEDGVEIDFFHTNPASGLDTHLAYS